MKKILIVAYYKYSKLNSKSGGVHVYSNALYDILRKYKYDVSFESIDDINRGDIKLDDYDLIINQTYEYLPKKYNDKILFVMHCNNWYFSKRGIVSRYFYWIIKGFKQKELRWMLSEIKKMVLDCFRKNITFYYNNIVTYNKYYLTRQLKKRKVYYGSFPMKLVTTKSKLTRKDWSKKNNEILYLGRLADNQKNIKLMNKIIDNVKVKTNIVGSGDDEKYLTSKYHNKLGFIDNNIIDSVDEIINSKVAIFTSRFEGACISLHECLSFGIIPITSNFGPEVKAVIPDSLFNLLVIKKYNNIHEWSKKITIIMSLSYEDYNYILNTLNNHYKKTYTNGHSFEDDWINIITSKLND